MLLKTKRLSGATVVLEGSWTREQRVAADKWCVEQQMPRPVQWHNARVPIELAALVNDIKSNRQEV